MFNLTKPMTMKEKVMVWSFIVVMLPTASAIWAVYFFTLVNAL